MKKKIIFIISLIVILTISAFILLMNKFVQADSLGGQDNLVDLAHLGYDGVIDIPYSREYMHDGNGWKGCQQVMCIHHSKKDGPGTFLVAIVDINPDGDDPSGGVAHTANGETTLSSNDLNKFAAAFAYYCENIAEDKNNDFNTAKHPFQIFWGSDGYKSYLEGQLGISLTQPSSSQLNPGWNPRVKDSYKFANEYMNESDPETTYSARIFVFDAGGDQARLVIFGKEAEPEDKIELDINNAVFSSAGRYLAVCEENGQKFEPYEELQIECPDETVGTIIEQLGLRGANMDSMSSINGQTRLIYTIPSRGLIGFTTDFMTMTKGYGIINHTFKEYRPMASVEIGERKLGVLVSMENGKTTAYALGALEDRGVMFVEPGVEVYEGMIVGEHTRENDLAVNAVRGKNLTNVRASGSDHTVVLKRPRPISLEYALDYINSDELVEVTPSFIRLRKKILNTETRKKFDAKK